MPDTGGRREIKRFVNAKEVETVQQSTKLAAKTKELLKTLAQDDRFRKKRNSPANSETKPGAADRQQDREASERMVDEGDPATATVEERARIKR